MGDVDQFPTIDVTIDGADEVDVSFAKGVREFTCLPLMSNERTPSLGRTQRHQVRPSLPDTLPLLMS